MPRIRTVKPEFFEDEDLGMLSRDARLLFIATWGLADDEGLLRWTGAFLKAGAFMYDDDLGVPEVEQLMQELVDAEMILPYRGGKSQQRLGWIVNFRLHQKINRPSPGRLPPPSIQNREVLAAYCRRDRWTCGICSEAVEEDPVARGLAHKKQPSLDHIVPRSQGGTDYPSNIRLAHQACNAGRGANPEYEVSDYVKRGVSGSVNRSVSDSPPEQGTGNREQGTPKPPEGADEEAEVFAYWQERLEKPDHRLTRERRRKIRARLREGYSVEDIKVAIDGIAASPFHRGANENGREHVDLELICRNGSKLEEYRDMGRKRRPKPPSQLGPRARDRLGAEAA